MNINIENLLSKVTFRSQLLVLLAICAAAITPAIADDEFDPKTLCPDPESAVTGNLSSGLDQEEGPEYLICVPNTLPPVLNACALVFAHGTVNSVKAVNGEIEPVEGGKLENIEDQLSTDLIQLAAPCAFAVVSRQELGVFSQKVTTDNGEDRQLMAIQELAELAEKSKDELVAKFGISADDIDVFGTGASQGGLLMTLTQERTNLFDGAIAACGAYEFQNQVNFFHDAIVVFDYLEFISTSLFDQEAIIPTIPDEVIIGWDNDSDSDIESQIRIAVKEQWNNNTREFLRILGLDRSLEQATGIALMEFSEEQKDIVASEIRYLFADAVFNLKDFQQKMCRGDFDVCTTTGNTFSNEDRVYSGSDDDTALNEGVQRFLDDFVDEKALDVFNDRYTVSGELRSFTTTLHGIGDINVPYEPNAIPYEFKASSNSPEKFLGLIPVKEIVHCEFDPLVAFFAFFELRQKAASPP